MTAIDNAVSLMNNPDLFDKIKAVSVFQARIVVTEPVATPNHAKRMQLAQTVVVNPVQYASLLHNIVACDPDICSLTADPKAIPDNTLITKMDSLWTSVALMLFP